HVSGEQVYKGLAGMIIVDDDEHPEELPGEYGVDDVPLILQDRRFADDGAFQYRNRYEDIVLGMMGDTILVNGTWQPQFRPRTRLVRFRLLNAANARTFHVALSDNRPFQQIGGDGGLLTSPVTLSSLRIAPGERAEIIVRFNPGESVNLVSLGREVTPTSFPGAMPRLLRQMNSEAFNLLALHCESSLEERSALPETLTEIYRLPEAAATNTRTFELGMGSGMRSGADRGPGNGPRNGTGGGFGGGRYFINGRVMAMDYINERVPLNTTEIWEVSNDSPMMHPFHIHNGQFQVLDRSGEPPPANEMGWKDTVQVGFGETVRLIMRFTDYADENNPYMYHCHILEHEDLGMMGQFVL
ncbi:MAG: multicopper oxidase domain-containing protein, partial [Pseudohongiellaceae bacterium]